SAFSFWSQICPFHKLSVWPARKIITELKKSSGGAGVSSSPTSAGRPETAHPTARIKKKDQKEGLHPRVTSSIRR
ncbi:MAG: hypothetical protein M1438_08470, partial [Deltaproteobacteria bacterium]|nr:hypothetical protein [Deltaproteobacteria bacterium]